MLQRRIKLTLLLAIVARQALAAQDEGSNAQEFRAFCTLVKLSEEEPELPRLRLDFNLTSFREDFQNFELLTSERGGEHTLEAPRAEWLSRAGVGNQSLQNAKQGPRLKKIRELAENLSGSCVERGKMEKTVGDAVKILLKKGVFGEGATLESKSAKPGTGVTDTTVFVDITGGSGAGNGKSCADTVSTVGKTLANDMFCLCVPKTSGGKEVCHASIKPSGSHWPRVDSTSTFADSWATIFGACPKGKLTLTKDAIHEALLTFKTLLGRGAGISGLSKKDAAPYYFGKVAHNGGTCDGDTGSSGSSCVNYKTAIGANDDGIERIKWVKNFKDAEEHLGTFERLTKECSATLPHTAVLHERAKSLFDEALRERQEAGLVAKPRIESTTDAKEKTKLSTDGHENSMAGNDGRYKIGSSSILILVVATLG